MGKVAFLALCADSGKDKDPDWIFIQTHAQQKIQKNKKFREKEKAPCK